MNLATMALDMNSPKGISEIASVQKTEKTSFAAAVTVSPRPATKTTTSLGASANTLPKQNSLDFQLGLLEGHSAPCTEKLTSALKDVATLAFPNLPATISDSSCYKGLTREALALHVPASETDATKKNSGNSKESSFGWFVDLDDGGHRVAATPAPKVLPHAVSTDDLAFHAPTAPKGISDDSEIEWAQAADTVDS
ncbi:MAG: hypothetical protein SGARI_000276, partial [Bacillariaceae sp.]